jgi:hypothetical protein
MGLYNPLRLQMSRNGKMLDKYGREFVFDAELHRKARRSPYKGGRVSVAYFSHKRKP